MSNNNAFIDAIIAGAGGGAQTAWLASSNVGTYTNFKNAILEIATAVDGLIPTIAPGPSLSQINLMEAITAAVLAGRFPQNSTPGTYADIATKIVLLYNTLASSLNNVPNVYGGGGGGGGGSLTNLSNVFWVDYATTVTLGDQNGNIETPFGRLAQAIAAVPDGSVLLVTPNVNYTTEGFLTVTKSIDFIAIGESNKSYELPAQIMSITVEGNIIVTFRGFAISGGYGWGQVILTTGSETVRLENCHLNAVDSSANGGTAILTNCRTSIFNEAAGGIYHDCIIDVGAITMYGDLEFRNCQFLNAPQITFDSLYQASFDRVSFQSLLNQSGMCTVFAIEPQMPIQWVMPVSVPDLSEGTSAYVDVDVSSTPLSFLVPNQAITAYPNVDMIGSEETGNLAWARVSAPATIRCCFTGSISAGDYDVLFAAL
jgi:hypothetical protein